MGCGCCGRSWDVAPRPIRTAGNSAGLPGGGPSICADCLRHMGSDGPTAVRRDRQHVDLWADTATALLAERDADHAVEVAALHAEIASRDRLLAERPERVVVQNLDRQTVYEAEAEAERAFRSRDHAYRVLVEIRLLHRETTGGGCRCGRTGCPVSEILDDFRALERWEAKQIDRLKQGLPHDLPAGHPALLDRRGWASERDA